MAAGMIAKWKHKRPTKEARQSLLRYELEKAKAKSAAKAKAKVG